ncbi:MAG: monofunctional biosynthetic peptidoglycan transglycosylase [Acidobacteriaceae bacterium]|nr:monofunctional biosynthetic peptidoglycan transglycosylase [Acidobacteriaceae bacterium]
MRSTTRSRRKAKAGTARGWTWLRAMALGLTAIAVVLYGCCALSLLLLKWVNPVTTAVQVERRLDAAIHHRAYRKQYRFIPLQQISPNLQHAAIAAEDERFRQHAGIDWVELRRVMEEDVRSGKVGRGASTITQQLVKNLYLSTGRSAVRKGVEFAVVPLAEAILGKDRILELYLNVIEWGPGIYGAEAAAEFYFKMPAARLGREESARLAACIPAPLKRRPAAMGRYAEIIEIRMRQMGW